MDGGVCDVVCTPIVKRHHTYSFFFHLLNVEGNNFIILLLIWTRSVLDSRQTICEVWSDRPSNFPWLSINVSGIFIRIYVLSLVKTTIKCQCSKSIDKTKYETTLDAWVHGKLQTIRFRPSATLSYAIQSPPSNLFDFFFDRKILEKTSFCLTFVWHIFIFIIVRINLNISFCWMSRCTVAKYQYTSWSAYSRADHQKNSISSPLF